MEGEIHGPGDCVQSRSTRSVGLQCVCVCVSGAQFLDGKTEALKPDGGTQTSSRDGPKLLTSELVNHAEPSPPAPRWREEPRGWRAKGRRPSTRAGKGEEGLHKFCLHHQ